MCMGLGVGVGVGVGCQNNKRKGKPNLLPAAYQYNMNTEPESDSVKQNWKQISMDRYSKEFTQLFGGLDLGSRVRISRLNRIGHVNRMDNTRKVSQIFNNNP